MRIDQPQCLRDVRRSAEYLLSRQRRKLIFQLIRDEAENKPRAGVVAQLAFVRRANVPRPFLWHMNGSIRTDRINQRRVRPFVVP